MSEQVNMAAHYEHEIPEGYEAKIEGNKVIIELKESEDERITRRIGDILEVWQKEHGFAGEIDDLFAWLEATKKNKRKVSVAQVPGDNDLFDKELNELSELEEAADYYMQGEIDTDSDMVDDDNEPLYYAEALRKAFLFGANWQKEQKPAEWSEEDEDNLHNIKLIIENFNSTIPYSGGNLTPSKEYKQELISLLKSLRPQPKVEWNKEDERKIQKLVALLKSSKEKCMAAFYKDIDECIAWICELRLSWKPSEEQMRTLIRAQSQCCPTFAKILQSIHDDLKKLM